MASKPKHQVTPNAVTRLAGHIREAAEASDRWLDGIGSDIGELGVWARSEAQVVGESLSVALNKTIAVTKSITKSTHADVRHSPREVATSSVTREVEHAGILKSSLSTAAPHAPSSTNLDLLPTNCDGKAPPALDEENVPAVAAGYAPGVLPVLQALERVVSDHAGAQSRSLQRDFRFWKLIELLQMLKPAQQQRYGEHDDSHTSAAQEA